MITKMIFKYLTFIPLVLLLISFSIKAESTFDNRTEEISLPSVQCGMCKKTIEKAVSKIEGVLSISVDVDGKNAMVTFDDSKTSLKALEIAVTKAGYDANNREADKKAYDKLHDCCKMP